MVDFYQIFYTFIHTILSGLLYLENKNKPSIFSFVMKKNIYGTLIILLSIINSTATVAQQNSLLFDGVDDKVTVPANALFNSANTLTLEAWINATQWKSQVFQGTIIGKDATNQSGYVLRCGANGKLSFTVGNGGGTWTEVSSTSIMQTNIWYHVAGVFDNGTMSIYINGVLAGSTTSNSIAASTVGLQVGESTGYPGRVFQGYIDEVRIWNVARTQTQIIDNDTVDLPNNEPGLVAYYKFNQVSGTTTPNEIAATTNSLGTLVNFPVNPWGPGYSIGGPDLSTTAILSPDRITFFSGASRVRAQFKNNSGDSISGFTVGYQLDSGTPVIETVNDTLAPNQVYDYAFHGVIEGGIASNYILKVFGTLVGDYNILNDTVSYNYVHPVGANNTITLFSGRRHDFGANGQSHLAKVPLPDENTKYSQILMNITLACPVSGCDPWDQPAKISLLKDGQTYELARFITPYGKGCGPWTVDVTSFKSMLVGACNFESYIQVWGASGWLLTATLTYVESPTGYPYQKVTRLWETDNWVYGDPNISYDLPLQSVSTNSNTQELEFRMTNSGHGQANTDNAAEFSPKTHTVVANGLTVASHFLWKTNCAQNTCNNQAGTWLYSRAGWCPGQEVQPYLINLTPQLIAGQNITVDYVLQTYVNLLNTGYNGGSHTEPHYKIHAFLVEKSDIYIDGASYTNAAATRINFPLTDNDLTPATPIKVMIRNTGTTVINNPDLFYFINGTQLALESPTITLNPGDSLEYTFTTLANLVQGNEYHVASLIASSGDQASSDDVASIIINNSVGISDMNPSAKSFIIYPNPTHNEFTIIGKGINENATVRIFDMIGKTVFNSSVTKEELHNGYKISTPLEQGTYLIQLNTSEGLINEKLMID